MTGNKIRPRTDRSHCKRLPEEEVTKAASSSRTRPKRSRSRAKWSPSVRAKPSTTARPLRRTSPWATRCCSASMPASEVKLDGVGHLISARTRSSPCWANLSIRKLTALFGLGETQNGCQRDPV